MTNLIFSVFTTHKYKILHQLFYNNIMDSTPKKAIPTNVFSIASSTSAFSPETETLPTIEQLKASVVQEEKTIDGIK